MKPLTAVLIHDGVIIKELDLPQRQLKIHLNKPLKKDYGWERNYTQELMELNQTVFWFVCQKGDKCYYSNV